MMTELPDKFRYLFENMEQEMAEMYGSDPVIIKLRDDAGRYEGRIGESERREQEASAETARISAEISEREVELRHLDRQRRIAFGAVARERHNQSYLRRLIKARALKVCAREKQLLLWEAKKRLNAIGRTLKHNVGNKRPGGGFDIVHIE